MQDNTTREIPLTKGKIALVDAEDFEWLSEHSWSVKTTRGGKLYAQRWRLKDEQGESRMITMHREILNPPRHLDVDHRNGDGLDNRRENLRLATGQQNRFSRANSSCNASGFKGVYQRGNTRWYAAARLNKHLYHLGYFGTPEEAARAYDRFAREHHGEFAWLNFPEATQ